MDRAARLWELEKKLERRTEQRRLRGERYLRQTKGELLAHYRRVNRAGSLDPALTKALLVEVILDLELPLGPIEKEIAVLRGQATLF